MYGLSDRLTEKIHVHYIYMGLTQACPNYLYITAVKYLKLLQLVNFVQILLRKNL